MNEGVDQAVGGQQRQGNQSGHDDPQPRKDEGIHFIRDFALPRFYPAFDAPQHTALTDQAVEHGHDEHQHDQGAGHAQQPAVLDHQRNEAGDMRRQFEGPLVNGAQGLQVPPQRLAFEKRPGSPGAISARTSVACLTMASPMESAMPMAGFLAGAASGLSADSAAGQNNATRRIIAVIRRQLRFNRREPFFGLLDPLQTNVGVHRPASRSSSKNGFNM